MDDPNTGLKIMDEPNDKNMFRNIRAVDLTRPEDVEALRVLHISHDVEAMLAAAEALFARGDLPCRCAVMDVFSYAYTVGGDWLYEPFAPWSERLLDEARKGFDRLRPGPSDFQKELRDRALGSCLHMFWRVPEPPDDQRVLDALADESHSSILSPALYATWIRGSAWVGVDGDTSAFAAAMLRAHERIARREDLDPFDRAAAIELLGDSPEAYQLARQLMTELPQPLAAHAALHLLNHEDASAVVDVRAAVQQWPLHSGDWADLVRSKLRAIDPDSNYTTRR